MKLFHLALAVVAPSLCFTAFQANAATTDPVGAASIDIPQGPTVVSFPFLKAVVYQSTVDSIVDGNIGFSTNLPNLEGPHFVHVLSGADLGKIFTIDTSTASGISLFEVPSGITVGDSVAIRPHTTLSDLGTPPSFTTVTFLGENGTPFVAFANLQSEWDVNPSTTIIYPGEGMVVNNNSNWNILMSGSVAVDVVIFSAYAGPQILGSIDPVNGSTSILNELVATLPSFTTITALEASGAPQVFFKGINGWDADPVGNIDLTDYKTFIINTSQGMDVVNSPVQITN